MSQTLYILTGNRHCGKTVWLQKAADSLLKKDYSLFGVLAPGIWENDEKLGIENVLIPSMKKINFAFKKPENHDCFSSKWKFCDSAIKEVNEHFAKFALEDYLIIDELGPLEFEQNKGLTNAYKILQEAKFKKAIVVVRPSLLNIAKTSFCNCPDIRILDIVDNPKLTILL